MEALNRTPVEWKAASRPRPGEPVSGDGHVARPFPGGFLLAVVDGLGHGEPAHLAAYVSRQTLERLAGAPPIDLIMACHEALRGTRGATISVASFRENTGRVEWLGVGNVGGVVLRRGHDGRARADALLVRSGVVGLRLPTLRASSVTLSVGDTLVLATDGIREEFVSHLPDLKPPERIAERVLADYGRTDDDALVVVARYVGFPP